jgi:hypothetical protein
VRQVAQGPGPIPRSPGCRVGCKVSLKVSQPILRPDVAIVRWKKEFMQHNGHGPTSAEAAVTMQAVPPKLSDECLAFVRQQTAQGFPARLVRVCFSTPGSVQSLLQEGLKDATVDLITLSV